MMVAKIVPPSTSETAFNCPHCGALAQQHWYSLRCYQIDEDHLPYTGNPDFDPKSEVWKDAESEEIKKISDTNKRALSGEVFYTKQGYSNSTLLLRNVHISECFNCKTLAIWFHDKLAYPFERSGPEPNSDLPDEIRADYEEARSILNLSPRGSAALLRLSVQKLCRHLGEPGKNINDDIASLVAKGLDLRVQQALDLVRVIGNNAVHPGQIDLKDDRVTASSLFDLVNLIADVMISQPKHLQSMYNKLPKGALAQIIERDGRSLT